MQDTNTQFYAIIIPLALFLMIAGAICGWLSYSNTINEQSMIVYSFNAKLPPSGVWSVNNSKINKGTTGNPEGGLSILSSTGDPQISCPSGYKINIIGAYLEVNDPLGSCSNNPSDLALVACGIDPKKGISCKVDGDCGDGMGCTGGKCASIDCDKYGGDIPKCPTQIGTVCNSTSASVPGLKCVGGIYQLDPGAIGSCVSCVGGKIVTYPTCQNSDFHTAQNVVCKGGACKPRDASAYLAAWCDGKSSCLGPGDVWNPNGNANVSQFGPLPCNIPATSTDSRYASLPVVTGWGGGAPAQSKNGTNSPVTFNQGYYVHGVYSCIPV